MSSAPPFAGEDQAGHVPSFGRLLMAAPIAPDDLPERDPSPMRPADF